MAMVAHVMADWTMMMLLYHRTMVVVIGENRGGSAHGAEGKCESQQDFFHDIP